LSDLDHDLMGKALELGRRGDPSPNPHVGCVIADGARILAESFHQTVGMDHAEIAALTRVGSDARGRTLYVTLEPCNHEGRTPPCVDAVIRAGIRRVVLGCRDPNPNVRGGGVERLREAGIEVTEGVRKVEAQALIRPWEKFITQHSSYLTLKLAMSVDGRIATRSGDSKWVTGEEARKVVHELRARHDAVLVGINTVLSDDPLLTVRRVEGTNPARVVVTLPKKISEDCLS
jgi:diaminohydroxyphosphoribosylaminopyrimidine deaminase/5-amino-6-(5-phosphoribosylamino)uracil reductase